MMPAASPLSESLDNIKKMEDSGASAVVLHSLFEEQIRLGNIKVLFNSMPIEFRVGSVAVDCDGQVRELPNDFVWIFAGGTPPSEFLKASGIAFGLESVSAAL